MKIYLINGTIVDGTGAPAFPGDLVIQDDKIAAVLPREAERSALDCADADLVLNVRGKTITPGLLDMHSHADVTMPKYPAMENYLQQGITTLSVGHCSIGIAPIDELYVSQCIEDPALRELGCAFPSGYDPYTSIVVKTGDMRRVAGRTLGFEVDWTTFGEFLEHMRREGVGCNIHGYVSYGQLRLHAMHGEWQRSATSEEIERMKTMLRRELEGGAYGVHCGFDYMPDLYATPEEVAQVAQVLLDYDAVLEAHTQNTQERYGRHNPDYRASQGIRELLEIGRKTGVRVHISHIPDDALGLPGYTKEESEQSARDILAMIEEYKAMGVRATWDVIPPDCMSMLYYPQLASFFAPLVNQEGGMTPFAARLRTDKAYEQWILDCIARKELDKVCNVFPLFRRYLSDPEGESTGAVQISGSTCKEAQGRTIAALSKLWGIPQVQVILEVLKRDPAAYYYKVNKAATSGGEDIFLSSPDASVGLDSTAADAHYNMAGYDYPLDTCPPNNFNAMIKYLTETQLPFEQAIYKASGRSADILRMPERGRLLAGKYADVVVLDRDKLAPVIDPVHPTTGPKGVEYVLVNGKFAVMDGQPTHLRNGTIYQRGKNEQ